MKKFFDIKALKSGEDCKKFSKSVSYETLAGGTPATGREYKQTQRLFLSSADKPLTAVGTLTSLLCNSAKVLEKWLRNVITRRTSVRRGYLPEQCTHANKESLFANVTCFMRLPRRIQRMLLVMTIPASCRKAHKRRFLFNLIRRSLEKFFKKNFRDDSSCFGFAKVLVLALIFTLIITAESQADTNDINCKTGQQSCGANCCWSVEGNTLKVTGGADGSIGKMDDYRWNNEARDPTDSAGNKRPWSEYKNVITSAEITNVSNIGKSVFHGFSKLTNVQIDNTVEIIGNHSFDQSGLTSINIPDSVTKIEDGAFWFASHLEEVSFSNALIDIEAGAFNGCKKLTEVTLPENLKYLGGFSNTGIVNFYVPDNVETIRGGTFSNNDLLYVNIPDTITELAAAFGSNLADMPDIICRGSKETCSNLRNLLSNYRIFDDGWKKADISEKMSIANYSQCYGTSYFWNGAECVREPDVTKRKCCSSCKDMGGYCNRIRYTPAEAAEVLRDDNTNEIVITFKK